MNKLQASHQIIELPDSDDKMGVLKHLERIGRTCYKSEDKITDESCFGFLQKIRDRKHWAMLEHYFFVISVGADIFEDFATIDRLKMDNPDLNHAMRFINITSWETSTNHDYRYIISGSATAFNYLWECDCLKDPDDYPGMWKLLSYMYWRYRDIMRNPTELMPWPDERDMHGIRFLSRQEIENLPVKLRYLHDSMTVRFNVDRGVTHELVRHRPMSWAQESTRYCNYSKGKEGSINLIDPIFWQPDENDDEQTKLRKVFIYQLWESTGVYLDGIYQAMTKLGAPPQEARSILPQSTKAEIVMTGTMLEMRHFFRMRVPATAHPQMREVTIPLYEEVLRTPKLAILFSDLNLL